MTEEICASCASLLNGLSSDKHNADKVEITHPGCFCEKFSVGKESPGIVQDEEAIYRLIISPGDMDDAGNLISTAFKDAYLDGLSLFRGCASDEDVSNLVVDRLTRKTADHQIKVVLSLIEFPVVEVRSQLRQELEERAFCVYDETVPRRHIELKRVPTHVSVLQRLPAAGTADRKTAIKSDNYLLYTLSGGRFIDVEAFRGGLIAKLNERARSGDFIDGIAENGAVTGPSG